MKNSFQLSPEELCEELKILFAYEIANGNQLTRIDRGQGTKIDLLVVFEQPLYSDESERNIQIPDGISRYVMKSPEYPIELCFVSWQNQQGIAGPDVKETLRNELCEDLRTIYDYYEISKGNIVERIDRYAWEKIDLSVVFLKPLFIEKPKAFFQKRDALVRHADKDPHYPMKQDIMRKRKDKPYLDQWSEQSFL